jgi:hypothetical protein
MRCKLKTSRFSQIEAELRERCDSLPKHNGFDAETTKVRSTQKVKKASDGRHVCSRATECVVPITPFLNGERFDPETRRILGVALELTCIALRTGDCADDVKQAIADKLIALARTGERNADVLCERVLRDIRGQQSDGENNRHA